MQDAIYPRIRPDSCRICRIHVVEDRSHFIRRKLIFKDIFVVLKPMLQVESFCNTLDPQLGLNLLHPPKALKPTQFEKLNLVALSCSVAITKVRILLLASCISITFQQNTCKASTTTSLWTTELELFFLFSEAGSVGLLLQFFEYRAWRRISCVSLLTLKHKSLNLEICQRRNIIYVLKICRTFESLALFS